ncbi:uncharacterized protein [Aegilops tauschii subsp. strangulata]|uniref:uncharacterized protein isoform X2 n=1 Tax=Aegilops tauschii subsp. strangulata TaxID=200361 RepID=UPI00098A36AE|nr:BAG family molecular chaperone regulator 6 isoform X2 [Aegilops tauschii subsp. strangulata]
MDPYSSYYRHHAPYPYYPPPGWEAGHKQMPEPDCSPCRPPYRPWPYSASMNHSGLPESHSCCSHTYPPGYYSFRPPFPQELPPPPYPLYYHGPFPPHHHPNPYSSSSYFGPLPLYPVDQTPYNGFYDKFKSHCCGCPNHVCHGDGGQKSNVKIEEHMPEVKPESNHKGADNNSSIIRNPNYQYPVMWLPSGDMKDNKGGGRSFEFPPHLFSKWFPQSGERTEDVKPADGSQKAKQVQWPMVWMPPGYGVETKPEAKKEPKEIEQSPKNTQEDPPSPKIKIIPLSWFGNDHHDQKPAARDGPGEQNGRSSATSQTAGTERRHDTIVDGNCKTVPVVPEKPNSGNEPAISVVQEKPNSANEPATISVVPEKHGVEKKVHTCRTIPVMAEEESDEKKSYMGGNKEEKKAIIVQKEGENKKSNNVESTKAKPSKLPPVCLRVDPLPKKKSGNTSSRSSNQATQKVCEKVKDVKEAHGKNQETKLSEHQKEGKMPIKEKSSDEIATNTGPRNVTVLDASVKHAQEKQVSTSMTDQKVQPSVSAEAQENVSARSLQECDKNRKEDELKIRSEAPNLACEIKLSSPDAAVRIQSAYRGYHVRRWQPLEKLRKIKNVHKQMQDVEKQLQALEASSKQPTEKEHIAINETIMNLLLNLDTIQNLHPVVREARKSVARQLVCLQEKLDSLCKKLPAEPNHPKSEEASLTGVDGEQLPSSVNSNESMHDELSSEVALKLSQDGDSTEQKHQTEEPSTAKEEVQDEEKAAAAGECQGVPPTDVMPDAASSGLITEKKHQIEEPGILREECAEECSCQQQKDGEKGEESSTHHIEPLHYTPARQNCHTEESDQRVSRTTTEDGKTSMTTACMDSELAADNDGSAEGGQVQESAPVGISWLKHDAAPAEDQFKEPGAPSLHLEDEDSSVPSKAADPHENDPAIADDSIAIMTPADQQEESVNADMQKEVAETMVDSDKEPNGMGDAGNMDYVTGANAETTKQEKIGLVGPEATRQCDVSHMGDSALVEQQNEGGSAMENTVNDVIGVEPEAIALESRVAAIVEETEAVPLEIDGKTTENTLDDAAPLENRDKIMENTMNVAIGEDPEAAVPLEVEGKTIENTLNDAVGEEPEAVPLESRVKTMENTLNDAGCPSKTSAEPALPESRGDGAPCEHGGATVYANPNSKVPSESHGGEQKEQDDDGGKVDVSESLACAVGANSAVPAQEAGEPEEGAAEGAFPEEEEAAATAPATRDDGLKSSYDGNNTGVSDENQKLKEMLQKVLASGNDQMGVIAELSDKVKSLERKLAAHKRRRPKVRVQHRPARDATANDVH